MADPEIPRVLTEAGDVEDADLTGELYPEAHPHLDTIRNGLPDLLDPSRGGSPGQFRDARSRRASNASSCSGITVSDRGDELYEALPPRPEEPAQADGQPLWKRFTTLRSKSFNTESFYFPRCTIDRIFTHEDIQKIVKEGVAKRKAENLPTRQEEYYINVIRTGTGNQGKNDRYIRILAILVLIRKEPDITSFVENDLSDADLPLDVFEDGNNFKDLRRKGESSSIGFLERCGWDARDHESFSTTQWTVLAPFFGLGADGEARFYSLSNNDILPWTKTYRTGQGGGFGDVFRVEIHPCNHNFDPKKGYLESFAIKQLRLSVEDGQENSQSATITFENLEDLKADFKAEIQNLNRFSGYKHEHLISLLAAYRRGDEYCLLFHWANGNLKELWEKNDPGSPLAEGLRTLRWMLRQCRGMVDGLCKVHVCTDEPSDSDDAGRIFGRHGDLKPQNILIFPESPEEDRRQDFTGSMLVISDFGMTKFHSDWTKTYFPLSATAATPTYRPPECDLTDCKMSRAFDIWSLGCIMLEFIAWHLGGWDLVHEFVQKRQRPWMLEHFNSDQFFEIVAERGTEQILVRVKLEVHEFVNQKLHACSDCSPLIHELLDYIMSNMLVVEANGIENRRDGAKDVLQKFEYLCSKLDDRDFAGRPAPRKMPDGNEEPPAILMPLSVQVREVFGYGRRTEQLREHTGRVIRSTDIGS